MFNNKICIYKTVTIGKSNLKIKKILNQSIRYLGTNFAKIYLAYSQTKNPAFLI